MRTSVQPGRPIVEFDEVQKSYDGETLVIKNLNLHVCEGEFLTLLGPSGSGKTTCLLMLAGFEPVTHGEIRVGERAINNVPPHKRNMGMVFQNYALFPHMTVEENVAYPLSVRGVSKATMSEKVKRALDAVQLAGYGKRRPAQLSGGQQQRVALARALVFEPTLVLMDEPLGALDRQLREHMQIELKHIHEQLGLTVVYVTHDQSEALTMSDRVAVFNDGNVEQWAAPEEIYERPANAFVAQFIGENNRLLGTVRDIQHNGVCTVDLGDSVAVQAIAVKVDTAGQRTTLSLRPEKVHIDPSNGELPNVLDGRVEETIFLGDQVRVRLSVLGQPNFTVKVPNAPRQRKLHKGEHVRVGWRIEDCRALDA
ncbi:MAG: ABC transporter ATP-binding protein [Gammaproteobacteria bacterium]|nr:ABC transporter ATP-binding protein [Gammaproteobacteria bacterium]NIR85602.1 ABC transporter ATP-binding protein [Gammaproteobacteria bacterium]NIR90043.1 ABC transporter ATP-binding protein [Gammaproteobacteria bacterium]NIU06731.1 ABC transporter ATP-binding protein [Gammaproteobacteria bacterium]NIV53662.1 polyamine ABC transporter ATP-binding protein [Gammaproteobacteria bacterium]